MPLEVRVLGAVSDAPRLGWDALVGDANPFCEHTFLTTLESAGCVGEGTGWMPCPVTVWRAGTLVGAAPAYIKAHSYGEFVYDWQWATFAQRNGVRYYPKIVVGSPFSPVTGARIFAADAEVRSVLVDALRGLGARASGLHVLFPSAEDTSLLAAAGGMVRLQWQYHFENPGYRSFDDYLAELPTKRRTQVRKERRAVHGLRIEAGEADPERGRWFYQLYRDTHLRHTGAEGYLAPTFFEQLFDRWSHRLHTVLAFDGDRPIAGTLNVRAGDRLYGRYWGTLVEVPFLHFEVAIYAAVEWCIHNGVRVFEPGHGGEHKRARGFTPRLTTSVHWITEPRLDAALRDYCAREAEAVRAAVEE